MSGTRRTRMTLLAHLGRRIIGALSAQRLRSQKRSSTGELFLRSWPITTPQHLDLPGLLNSPLRPPNLRQRLKTQVSSPWSGSSTRTSAAMAPIVESTVDSLKDTIHKLEKRVWELENKLEGRAPSSTNVSDQMRMILIGPPGAGPSTTL